MTYEIIKNSLDANAFSTDDTSAGYVNPEYWNRQVLQYQEQKLVVADKAKIYDDILNQDGSSFNVTIDDRPTAASAVAESDSVSISAQSHSQATFTPSEYAKAYELSDKEMRRSFVDQMENMSKKIGYALALAMDDDAISTIESNASNTVRVNGKAATSDLASSDTLDFDTIVDAATKIEEDDLVARYLIVTPAAGAALAKTPQFARADQSGDQQAFRQGLLGSIYGLEVFKTTNINVSSSVASNIMIGEDQLGEPTFGIGRKLLPEIRTERHELDRKTQIVGVAEWDTQVLRGGDGLVIVEAHQGS